MKKGIRKIKRKLHHAFGHTRLFFSKRPTPDAVASVYGVWLQPNGDDQTFNFYKDGGYGFFYAQFLRSQRRPFTFLDIGANQGLYSMLASRNRNCRQVHAFEPVTQTADLLEKNLALNSCTKVRVHRKAISSSTGQAEIFIKPSHSGVASLVSGHADTTEVEVISTIAAAEVDALIDDGRDGIIIKIDVEGHEPTVLAELFKTGFADRVAAIFYECNETRFDPDLALSILKENGFSQFEQKGSGQHYDVLAMR